MEQRQQLSCTTLWLNLAPILGAIIGGTRWGWVGLLVGAPVGLMFGFLSVIILGLILLGLNWFASKKGRPPVD
jgi:hypothetical protein